MLVKNHATDRYEPTPKEINKLKSIINPDEFYKFIREYETDLDTLKEAKKNQLDYFCNLAIVSGFESDALGEVHTYPADEEAQRNLSFAIKRLEIEPELGVVGFKTLDAGYLNHTLNQLHEVFKDGFDNGQNLIIRYNLFKAQVYTSTSKEEIDAINW